MNDIISEIASLAVRALIILLGGIISCYVLPYLKEKKLYERVCTLVRAAEKLCQSGEIDKKGYVIAALEDMGIEVTPLIESMIESAVCELDILLKNKKSR